MKNKGFTLIELLVTIVIIAILAAISVSTFNGYKKQSKDARRYGDLTQIGKIISIESLETASAFLREGCTGNATDITNTTKCVIDKINNADLLVPDATEDCYVMGVKGVDHSKFFVMSSEQYLDEILVFYGNDPLIEEHISSTPGDYKYTNFGRLHNYINYYKNNSCSKPVGTWNGLALDLDETGYPNAGHFVFYSIAPLNPTFQN